MDLLLNIILWVVFGAIAGWVASLILGTNEQQSLTTDVVLGIIGAFIGGLVFQLLGFAPVTGFNIYSMVVAVLGAMIVIFTAKQFRHAS